MKILYLTSRLPIPPLVKGDTLRDFYIIRELASRGHEVYLVSFYRGKEYQEPGLELLKTYCSDIKLVKFNPIKQSLNLIKGLFSIPFQTALYSSLDFQRAVDDLIRKADIDVGYVHFARLAHFLRGYKIPKIIDFQDSFVKNMRDKFLKEKNFIIKLVALIESKKMEVYEKEIAQAYSFVTVVSERDLDPDVQNMFVVPNGVQVLRAIQDRDKEAQGLLFVGNMTYFPNEDAAFFLIKEIMPIISKKIPDLKLYIVGNKPSKKLRKYNSDRIIVTGFVPDVYPFYAKSRISVAPLQYGTGIQNKVLDAMMVGVPQIISLRAAEGFKNLEGGEFIISQCRKQEFSEKIIRLWNDCDLQKKLVENAKKYATHNYSWDKSVTQLESLFELAIRNH